MPFKFRMQKVLEYREQLEEEAKVRLAECEARHRTATKKLEGIRSELACASDYVCGNMLMKNGERWLHEQYIKGLKSDLAAQELQVRLLAQAVGEARKLVSDRAIERKLLDKLKERQKKHYVHEENLRERRFNDEIATLRYKTPAVKAGTNAGVPLPDQDNAAMHAFA